MEKENSAFVWMAFPSRIYHPRRTARTASRHFPLCIWLFHFIRHLAKVSLSSRRKGFPFLPMLPPSSEEFCTPVLRSPAPGASAKTSFDRLSSSAGAIMPPRVTLPTTTRGQHWIHDRHTRHPSFHLSTSAHHVEILSCQLYPAEHGYPSVECTITSSFGLALHRNKRTIVAYHFMKHVTSRLLQHEDHIQ